MSILPQLALLLLLAVLASPTPPPTCPDSVAIAPCVCSLQRSRQLILDCTAVTSQNQFAAVFQNTFPDKQFHQLRIRKSDVITSLDVDYNGVSFNTIWMSSGPFPNLLIDNSIPFPNQVLANTLTRIDLFRAGIESFPLSLLPLYKKLRDLQIVSSGISSIPPLKSDTLSKIRIERAKITEFSTDTFKDLTQLRQVNLRNNQLTTLAEGTIPLTPNAFSFNFASNAISKVEKGAFYFTAEPPKADHMIIDLSYNRLTTIDEHVFSSLMPHVRYLYVFGNPLECDCRLHWLLSSPTLMEKIPTFGTPKCFSTQGGIPLHDVDPNTLC